MRSDMNETREKTQDRNKSSSGVESLSYLWSEYSYRHDHCWKTVFSITAAMVLLSVSPYIRNDLTRSLEWGANVAPMLSVAVAAYGIYVIIGELRLLGKIRLAYRHLQNHFYEQAISESTVLEKVKHEEPKSRCIFWIERFAVLVIVWLVCLLVLALANLWFLRAQWIPSLYPC
jgi:hypothetical protein